MHREISITIRDKIAKNSAQNETEYICNNSDFVVIFDFDEEWSKYETKTARFRWEGSYADVVFTGNRCNIPVIQDTYHIYVGVFAGDLWTTTPAHISAKKSILCGIGSPTPPDNDVYAQIIEALDVVKQEIVDIESVDKLPKDPDPNTLYLIREGD